MSDVLRELYGAPLQNQGRGLYVSMELFAILRGSVLAEAEGEDTSVLPDPARPARFFRPGHDLARRIIGRKIEGGEEEVLIDPVTVRALRALLSGLQLPVPGRRREPGDWRQRHLYPFPPDLVHYDTVQRGQKINIEGTFYRGGGGLAHRMLREDPNLERLAETRGAIRRLFSDSRSPLGSLARALHKLDATFNQAYELWEDPSESAFVVHDSPWVEILRAGVHSIATRSMPESKAIEALLLWVPFCVLRHQQSLAFAELENSDPRLVAVVSDCLPENGPLRHLARSDFNRSWNGVKLALKERIRKQREETGEEWAGSETSLNNAKSFFAASAYAVGLVNASTGIRWFTLSPALLETIVLATVPGAITFVDFCDLMYRRLGLVVDQRAAQRADITEVDQSSFEDNSEAMSEVLHELGILERFSDTTRMVSFK